MILGSWMQLFPIISEFIALDREVQLTAPLAPTSAILKPSCPHPKAQCVRVRCAIRPSGAIKRSRTGHSLNNLRLQSPRENDVMIVVSETPACQHRKNPADPTTISLRVHHAVSTALVSLVILVWREELHGSSSSSEAFPGYTALG